MLTGSSDGYLKIYDLKTGGVKRWLQIANLKLTSIAEINDSNSVVIGSANNKMYLLNTTLGKATNSFEAHEDSITGVFYSQSLNKIISDGADSVYKLWDVNKKIPIQSYFDTDSQIVTCDYRDDDQMHMCIDSDGALAIRNMKSDKLMLKMNLDCSNYFYAKFDINELNKYYIANENGIDFYDLRMNKIIDSVGNWSDSKLFLNEGNYFLMTDQEEDLLTLREYENYESNLKSFEQFGKITHIRPKYFKNKQKKIIICGNNEGDIFYHLDI